MTLRLGFEIYGWFAIVSCGLFPTSKFAVNNRVDLWLGRAALWPVIWTLLLIYYIKDKRMTKLEIPQNIRDFAKSMLAIYRSFDLDFNDNITRVKFHALLAHVCEKHVSESFEYIVVCDQTNNPHSVIDAKDLVADVTIRGIEYTYGFHLSQGSVIINGWKN
jgi:hypothetical protein